MQNRNFSNESMLNYFERLYSLSSNSHVQAVAAKAARQKDRQQNFGSKTRYDNLNTNQVNISLLRHAHLPFCFFDVE